MERRLAAILQADVVGYSRLMGSDEAGTLAAFTDHRSALIDPKIAEHDGRIVKSTGDGVLAEFVSVVRAVHCAVEIQRGMARRNTDIPADKQLVLRIGINIGDIIEADGDIHGDGVNVAARLEGLSEPGGICVSRPVRNQVLDKVPYRFEDLGEKEVKNIARPVHVFRIVTDRRERQTASASKGRNPVASRFLVSLVAVSVLAAASGAAWLWSRAKDEKAALVKEATTSPADKPSIAVLPFDNLSDQTGQDSFSDGITHNIITDLSKFSGLFVIAANSTFRFKGQPVKPADVGKELGVRYILKGSVQRMQDQLRINAQLIDAASGAHIWADRYDRPTTDLFAVQNEIGRKIVEVIGPISDARGMLVKVELERLARTPTKSLEAYDHFLKGVVHYDRYNAEDNRLARSEFDKAIALDGGYAKARAKKAWTFLQEHWNGWGSHPENALRLAEKLAHSAIEADPAEPEAHFIMGSVRLFQKKHELAIESFEKAVELNPNGADHIMGLGWAITYAGRPDDGLRIMDEAISRNPYYPGWYLWDIAWGHFVARRYDEAIRALERRIPRSNFTHLMLAVNYAKVGRKQEAAESLEVFRKAEPRYSVEAVANVEPFKDPEDLEHFLEAPRAVGVPEHTPKD